MSQVDPRGPHYQVLDLLPPASAHRDTLERLFAKVEPVGHHWMWTGACSMTGYPNFRTHDGSTKTVARYLLELADGVPDPDEGPRYVRNLCGQRLCVNPDHWRWD